MEKSYKNTGRLFYVIHVMDLAKNQFFVGLFQEKKLGIINWIEYCNACFS